MVLHKTKTHPTTKHADQCHFSDILVAVPYWGKRDWELEYAVPDDFASHLPPIRHLFLYHSRSDEAVPFSSLRRYQEHLPQATVGVLDGKEHSFIEGLLLLAQDIKQLES
jgi:hypothetical protein